MLKTLRENLKFYRKKHGLSQEELSSKCNYDKTYVGKIERGDTNPSFEAILRITNVLDIPTIKLLQHDVSSDPDRFNEQLEDPSDQVGDLFVDVFENIPSISVLTNNAGEILQLNQAAKKFFKAKANDIIGKTIQGLSFWSQVGTDPSVIEDLCELGAIGKKATRRIKLRYKGRELDIQVQVSFADREGDNDPFVIYQLFFVEDTSNRTLIGDHFELLRG